MNKKQKIQELLNRLDALQNLDQGVRELLEEESTLAKDSLKERPLNKAIQRIADEVVKVKNDPRLDEVMESISAAGKENNDKIESLVQGFSREIESLLAEVKSVESRGQEMTTKERDSILSRLEEHKTTYEGERTRIDNTGALLQSEVSRMSQEMEIIRKVLETPKEDDGVAQTLADTVEAVVGAQATADEAKDLIEELRTRINTRLATIQHGGGNANRNIAIGGNTSVLSTFTDINLIAGSGITISYSKNQTTKYTDVTITGSGSGSGIIREINNIAVNTAAGAVAGTDYVYNVSGTTTLTLPTAVGNTNLYSVKNVDTGIVTVATTGGQTIDGSASASLPIQYLEITLYSDGSNWNVGV